MASNQNKITEKPLLLLKQAGETPLQALNRLRLLKPQLAKLKLTYAGRLDPLATGLLLVLVGEECKKKDQYLNLPKTYEVEILFGVATDSHDVLGKITKTKKVDRGEFKEIKLKLKKELAKLAGKYYQEYPKYSSPKISGKKQFGKEVEIFSATWLGGKDETSAKLEKDIRTKIGEVVGDFRQVDILKKWNNFFSKNEVKKFLVVKLKVETGSGVYMRLLADNLGKNLRVPALAFSIHRTRVGKYKLDSRGVIK